MWMFGYIISWIAVIWVFVLGLGICFVGSRFQASLCLLGLVMVCGSSGAAWWLFNMVDITVKVAAK